MRQNTEAPAKSACTVRADLHEEGLAPPVWRGKKTRYVRGGRPIPYRWVTHDRTFQVFFRRQWWYAESTDWDFE